MKSHFYYACCTSSRTWAIEGQVGRGGITLMMSNVDLCLPPIPPSSIPLRCPSTFSNNGMIYFRSDLRRPLGPIYGGLTVYILRCEPDDLILRQCLVDFVLFVIPAQQWLGL